MSSDLDYVAFDPATLKRLEELKAREDFPVAKGAALALIRLTQRESTSLAVLAHALKADPTFSVRLIKVANGASGAEHRPVVSLRDAVSVLGVPAVRALALGFSLLANHRDGPCGNFDLARFWSHALVRAVALQLFTAAAGSSEAEEAFSVGLLARVGELALAELFPAEYAGILERREAEPQLAPADAERQALGVTHAELTASIMLDCGLPEEYVEAAQSFESCEQQNLQPGSTPFLNGHLLALADQVADVCVAAPGDWRKFMPRLFRLGGKLSIQAGTLAGICDRVAHEWREWGPMLEIETGPMPRFEEVVAVAPPPRVAPPIGEPAPPPVAEADKGLSVLLVADREDAHKPLRDALALAGYAVAEAADGRLGLAMAVELQPQIMLIALQAGDTDGVELTRTLRQFKAGRSIYVLILLGASDDGKLVHAFEAGADDVVSLPLDPRVLSARLRAGQRVVRLQADLAREQEESRRIAAELSATNQKLQEVAMTDMLTGCPNRRYAMDRLQQEWAMAVRSQRPLACMTIEIDDFPLVNEIHGHEAGDTVLKLVASALKDEMRAQDVLARTGGADFLVVCPDTTLESAMACAERIRGVIEVLPILAGAQHVRGSVSVGVAVLDAATQDPDALIRLTDQSVYLAKRRRNSVAAVQSGTQVYVRSA